MNLETLEWIERSIRNAERRDRIFKILGADRAWLMTKGENYFSEICRLKLKVVLYSGEIGERHVIFKSLPSKESVRKFIKETMLFNIEKKIYKEVLPLMEKIRKDKESAEPLWGECYDINNSMMLMEDLAVSGYTMGDQFKGLDYDHCKLVMKSLAKFHALSVVLGETGNLVTSDFPLHFLQRNPKEMMIEYFKSCFENLAKQIEEDWKGEWLPYAVKIRRMAETIMAETLEAMSLEKSKFNVLNHGDFWVKNMLFKYNDDNHPVAVRFIDFQACYYNTLAIDLQYFITTSSSLDMFWKADVLLEIYSHWLKVYLEKFSYSGEIPSSDTIKAEYLRLAIYGFVTSVLVFPLRKKPSKESPELEKGPNELQIRENMEVTEIINKSEEYEKFMKAALLNAKKNGII